MCVFFKSEITPSIFLRIKGKSYGEGCNIPLDDLSYIRISHYGFDEEIKEGEMICSSKIADDLLTIFRKLYEFHYPIERVRLVDEFNADDDISMANNNSSSFNYRKVTGSTRLSKHALGLAVDINPLYNPYVRDNIVLPPQGLKYTDRSISFPHKIDKFDICYKTFTEYGFTWGGDWNDLKDYQHFER